MEKEKHVVFGISPFNTKFNEEYIFNMLDWGFENFSRVDMIHPHEEAKYLLMGCGNNEVKSKKKSRKEFSRVRKIVNKYLHDKRKNLNYGQIMKFADFYNSNHYNRLYESVKNEYESFSDFREICVSQTEKAILNRKKSLEDISSHDDECIHVATKYILREIPFIVAPAEVLSSNCHVYISYYSNWSIADYLYKQGRKIKPSQRTSLIIKDHSYMKVLS
ncbi:tRNA-dependent cyclodipeptide synthase [Xenorhabdus japonica]|uniref:Cyclodipeptide synthase n=1 Tax=Xenorhabdus japonica TaxID=53341 RepID=A0A1I5DEG8_9GAMM|nr:tRNA-dependent cyclodipeptide synthase [Xenorhabdus japonica]SFN97526.1 tRNA-dependent cyclodipeptide synthase [Xenorhabdus japonica]